MVFYMGFEMYGQMLNLLGQKRNLNFRGSSISLMGSKLLNYFVSTFRFLHAYPFFLFVLFNFPLTRRFPGVKVRIPAAVATALVPPQPWRSVLPQRGAV